MLRRSARSRKPPARQQPYARNRVPPPVTAGDATSRANANSSNVAVSTRTTGTSISQHQGIAAPVMSPCVTGCSGSGFRCQRDLLAKLWEKGYTPINVEILENYLSEYDKVEDAKLLVTGFKEGFRLNYTGPRASVKSDNLLSVKLNKFATIQKLDDEVSKGRMLGPFMERPMSNLRVSPIGLVKKADNSWRLITHLSFPEGQSVNDFIDEEYTKVNYASFDNVLEMISELGKGAKLGKIDIKSAFRLLPVHPGDFELLGIQVDGQFWIDKNLPMGCSASCFLFEKFATFLHWKTEKESGLDSLDHYLDDFLFGGSASSDNCKKLMDCFETLCSKLGIPLADNKTVGPTTYIIFLGLLIDTIRMLVIIPDDKVQMLKEGIMKILSSKKLRLKEFEAILGLMAFCVRAIPSARAFMRRFYDVLSGMSKKKPFYYVRISEAMKDDALVWNEFLESFNGECYLPNKVWVTDDVLQLYTDSAGSSSLGCGAYFAGHWVQFRWPDYWRGEDFMSDISFLELVPILLAFFVWKENFRSQKIILRTDNQALVSILNKKTSKSKYVMQLLRPLVLIMMKNSVQVRSVHIEGINNSIVDALSRFQMEKFRRLSPTADLNPSEIPVEFWSIISALN